MEYKTKKKKVCLGFLSFRREERGEESTLLINHLLVWQGKTNLYYFWVLQNSFYTTCQSKMDLQGIKESTVIQNLCNVVLQFFLQFTLDAILKSKLSSKLSKSICFPYPYLHKKKEWNELIPEVDLKNKIEFLANTKVFLLYK